MGSDIAPVHGKGGTRMPGIFSVGRIAGFFLAGTASTLTDLGLLYLLAGILGIWYFPAAAVSYSCGIAVNFCLNRRFTFRDRGGDCLLQFILFTVVSLSGLLVNLLIVLAGVEVFGLHYLAAKVIAVCGAFFWNYAGQSMFTFRPGPLRHT